MLSLQLPMKFGNTVRVGTSRYLTKITTLRRKADREQLRVLAAKHTASLQLLCTVGGTQARLNARTEFKISQRSGVKLVVQMSVYGVFCKFGGVWCVCAHYRRYFANDCILLLNL